MNDDNVYVFKDWTGKTHRVHGTPDAINALMVVFIRRDALDFILAEIAKMLELVKPEQGTATR